MSKLSVIVRNKKKQRLSASKQKSRDLARKIIKDPNATLEEKQLAQKKMRKLKRSSAKVQVVNRCVQTGRPRGVIRKFGLCRNMVYLQLLSGLFPGARKASW